QALRKEDLFKAPGVAETLDWAAALAELDVAALDPLTVSDTLGVLLKYQDDIARIQGGKVKDLIDEVRSELRAAEGPAIVEGGRVIGLCVGSPISRFSPGSTFAALTLRAINRKARAAASPRTSSTSPARCARLAFRSARERCWTRLPRLPRRASARAKISIGPCTRFWWSAPSNRPSSHRAFA